MDHISGKKTLDKPKEFKTSLKEATPKEVKNMMTTADKKAMGHIEAARKAIRSKDLETAKAELSNAYNLIHN